MRVSGATTRKDGRSSEAEQVPGPRRTLGRRQRVTRATEFREAFEKGRHVAGRYMVLWLRSGEGADLRLGVVVSKRSLRRAVARSRAKRLLREAYRLNRHRLRGDVDVVLVARQAIAGVKRQDVEKDLLRLAGKAGILKE